jgi:hypothetical protein
MIQADFDFATDELIAKSISRRTTFARTKRVQAQELVLQNEEAALEATKKGESMGKKSKGLFYSLPFRFC